MSKIVTLRLDCTLIEPLVETLQSRALAWQETARILRTQAAAGDEGDSPDPAAVALRKSQIYAALVQQIKDQLDLT